MPNKPNAGRKTLGQIMSDPQYLRQSLQTRRQFEAQQAAARRAMGVKNPKRSADLVEHVGFAEGVVSADEGAAPIKEMPILNPRFKRG